MRTLLIEPQRIFIPSLWSTLEQAGLRVEQAIATLDYAEIVRVQPQCVFFDIDFSDGEPLELIRVIRMLLPIARIAVYTSTQTPAAWQRACRYAGGNAVFSKSAEERELIEGVRALVQSGDYMDWRIVQSG
ncbi:MAG TPA: hypothetical protein VIG32_05720 [Candidatus Baltobacteraceae bacterium]